LGSFCFTLKRYSVALKVETLIPVSQWPKVGRGGVGRPTPPSDRLPLEREVDLVEVVLVEVVGGLW
jgi:hypothetical protein